MNDGSPLPADLEDRILEILGLSTIERAAAVDAFRAAHPEHVVHLDRALQADATRVEGARPGQAPSPSVLTQSRLPDHVGAYAIVEMLGRGGMGEVYRARQEQPVQREVALKVVRRGLATEDVLARFRLERRALAAMSHRSIAKVFDAGATESGDPYFVMELIEGAPLQEFADAQGLDLRARLGLFNQVCAAVQHAHQKGLVHRDLKPTNVLVAWEGTDAVAKVLDFGLAKVTNPDFMEAGLVSVRDQVMGTLEYMSPEQAAGEPDRIDARSDIYSLGVILYELLTGELPFSSARLREAGSREALRWIQEVEPPRPSAVVGANAARARIAEQRGTTTERLVRVLRGDLDWVVMRAMAKEPERRYASAAALAEDVQRYLDGGPVAAGPPSAGYRLRKLVRRYRVQVVAAGTVFVSIVAALVTSLVFYLDADTSRAQARSRADELQTVVDFQARLMSGFDLPAMGRGIKDQVLADLRASGRSAANDPATVDAGTVSALVGQIDEVDFTAVAVQTLRDQLFDRALKAIDDQFREQPLVRAQLLQTVGLTLHDLGLFDLAEAPFERSLAIRLEHASDGPETVGAMMGLGMVRRSLGKLEEAERTNREVLRRARQVHGENHVMTRTAMCNLGLVLTDSGKLDEAEALVRTALALKSGPFQGITFDPSSALHNLSDILIDRDQLEEAEAVLRQELQTRLEGNEGDRDDQATLTCMQSLAHVALRTGKSVESEQLYQEVLARRRRLLGDEHPFTLLTMNSLGSLFSELNRLDEAEPLLQQAFEGRARALGECHSKTIASLSNLAVLRMRQENHAASVDLLRDALQRLDRSGGGEPRVRTSVQWNLARSLEKTGKFEEAVQIHHALIAARRAQFADNDPRAEEWSRSLARCYAQWGWSAFRAEDLETSASALQQAYDAFVAVAGPGDEEAKSIASDLAVVFDERALRDPNAGHATTASAWRERKAASKATVDSGKLR
ncbi:MAG: serine/threonine-protein kinase [Planctomycetota bacterium]